jgi:hypothetical protein
MVKCEICEAQPSSYIDPVDFQQVCRDCFFNVVFHMLDPEISEEDLAQQNQN